MLIAKPYQNYFSTIIGILIWIWSTGISAQPENLRAAGGLDLQLSFESNDNIDIGTYQANLWAMVGKKFPLLYAIGLDVKLGGANPDGFQYELNLRPIGFGFLLGKSTQFLVTAGGGVGGLPFRLQAPVEARLQFQLGKRIRLTTLGRAVLTTQGNTFLGALTLRFGKRYYEGDGPYPSGLSAGNGYFLGGGITQDNGFLILIGYNIDGAWNPIRN